MAMVSPMSILDVFAALSFLAFFGAIRDHRRRRGLPYPPGPRSLPVIGNLLDVPKEFSWLTYTSLSEKYGTISFVGSTSFYDLSGRKYLVLPCFWAGRRRIEYC